jgi:hypothetical protein
MDKDYLYVKAFDDGVIYNDYVARLIKKNDTFKILFATKDNVYLAYDANNAIAIDYQQLFYYFEVEARIPTYKSVIEYVKEFYAV